jgi:hypothetical protein
MQSRQVHHIHQQDEFAAIGLAHEAYGYSFEVLNVMSRECVPALVGRLERA